jgi:hypothetical protein
MTDTDLYDLFIERASIMEYDGGLTRVQATYNAARDTKRLYGLTQLPEAIINECRSVTDGRGLD